jgi:hypothetical protein
MVGTDQSAKIETEGPSADRINYVALAARVRRLEKWVDTIETPMWKRLWFVAQGYRWRRLGVWYRAKWNADAWDY